MIQSHAHAHICRQDSLTIDGMRSRGGGFGIRPRRASACNSINASEQSGENSVRDEIFLSHLDRLFFSLRALFSHCPLGSTSEFYSDFSTVSFYFSSILRPRITNQFKPLSHLPFMGNATRQQPPRIINCESRWRVEKRSSNRPG